MREELLLKYFEGLTSKDEEEEIKNWLDAGRLNKKIFASIKQIYIEVSSKIKTDENAKEKAFENLLLRIKHYEEEKSNEKRLKILKLRQNVTRIAASFLLILSVGILSYVLGRKNVIDTKNKYCLINVPIGSRSQVFLPDGSIVWLNAGSKLKYNYNFGKTSRNIYLEGEAYFDVAKYANLPFYVHTSHLDIHVMGTKFNVKAYPDEKIIETTLIEGKVEVKSKNKEYKVALKPSQKLIYDKQKSNYLQTSNSEESEKNNQNIMQKKPEKVIETAVEIKNGIDIQENIGWKDGILVFNKESLENLVKKLERKYDINFIFVNEEIKTYTYTGTLRDYPLEQVLQALKLTSQINYSIKEKTVRLYKK